MPTRVVRDGPLRLHHEAVPPAAPGRIGQTEPVQVVFMAYRNTLQADALTLVAQKLQSSPAVEGELPEDGLAAYGDEGDDLMLAVARKIVAGEEDAGSVESVFEQARQVAAEAEALLVDAEWGAPKPQPITPEPVLVGAGADDLPEEDGVPRRLLTAGNSSGHSVQEPSTSGECGSDTARSTASEEAPCGEPAERERRQQSRLR